MKKMILLALLCTACGSDSQPLAPGGANGFNSLLYAIPGAPNCPNGGSTLVTGLDLNRDYILQGTELLSAVEVCNGIDGAPGSNGFSSVTRIEPSGALCLNGGSLILNGLDTDHSLTLELSEVQQTTTVCNGVDGVNIPAPAFATVETLNPCGVNGPYDEVLLRLFNGSVLGSFSENTAGLRTRLSLIPDGSFSTTDYQASCSFSLSTNGTQRCLNDSLGAHCWGL